MEIKKIKTIFDQILHQTLTNETDKISRSLLWIIQFFKFIELNLNQN